MTEEEKRLDRFIKVCAKMGDAGDGKRYSWWDELTAYLVELRDSKPKKKDS